MGQTQTIDLAHTPEMVLGRVTLRPPLRQVVRDDGAEEVLEPRVMQVLVALAGAKGGIVSRDDLTQCCWEGRVVGEDAINRVISRLRRSAEGIGAGSFRIETITKVGYRLLAGEGESDGVQNAAIDARPGSRFALTRRQALIGGGAAATAMVAGGLFRWRQAPGHVPPPADVAPLMAQAQAAMAQATVEGNNQAVGLLRRVVALHPDYADGWGMLALTYSAQSTGGAPQVEAEMQTRSEEARRRALALDPNNAYAMVSARLCMPLLGHWLEAERELRHGIALHPDNEMLVESLAVMLSGVGRFGETANLFDGLWKRLPPSPGIAFSRVQALWAADRFEEADRAMDDAAALFATHFAVWFTHFYLLMYTGRAREAIALGENLEGRPTGIPDWNFDLIMVVARAMVSRAKADVDAAIRVSFESAHRGAGFAENSIQFMSALGKIDEAFAIADAYYFARGFDPGELRFSAQQGAYTRRSARRTGLLFLPSTGAMRSDPRFPKLVGELGLARYWQASGTRPDYQRA